MLWFVQLQNVFLFSWNMVLISQFPESFSNVESICERNVLSPLLSIHCNGYIHSETIQIYETVTIKCDAHHVHVMYNIH